MAQQRDRRLYDEAVQLAARAGFRVCEDHLNGVGNNACRALNLRWIFVDDQQPDLEKVAIIARTVRSDLGNIPVSEHLLPFFNQAGRHRQNGNDVVQARPRRAA